MKGKLSFMWRAATALVLICSLGLVMAVPAGATEDQTVLIISPTAEPMLEVEVSDTFNVDATVTNNTAVTQSDVLATISWDPPAGAVVVDSSTILEIGDIPPGQTQHAQWVLHCLEAGNLTITVETNYAASDSVIVQQLGAPDIDIEIIDPLEDMIKVGVCTTFPVTAIVTNTGHEPLELVDTYLIIGGGANASWVSGPVFENFFPGSLDKEEDAVVTWTVHCDDADEILSKPDPNDPRTWTVDYTQITAYTEGFGTVTGGFVSDTDSFDVYQKYLLVEITSPSNGFKVNVSREFYIEVDITNFYDEDLQAGGQIWIDWSPSGGVELYTPPVVSQTLPAITVGETYTVLAPWHLHCLAAGDATIDVIALVIAEDMITLQNWDSITVIQEEPAALRAVITTPQTSNSFYISQNFPVTAIIYNDGDETATGVTADLGLIDNVNLVSGVDPQVLADIPGGESAEATWMVHCNGVGDATITVTPAGFGANTGEAIDDANDGYTDPIADSETVHQLPLTVVITEPTGNPTYSTSQTFSVSAELTHIGDGTAGQEDIGEVTATLVIDGPANVVPGESLSKVITEVLWGDTQYVTWTVHCNGPGAVIFTVEAATTWYETLVTVVSASESVYQEAPSLEVEILSPSSCRGDITDLELGSSGEGEAMFSDAKKHSGDYSAHLLAGAPGTGNEARIVVPLAAGTTLGDIDTISWWTYLVEGYVPHGELVLDYNGDCVGDTVLVAEGAHQNENSAIGWATDTWIQTFQGASGVYTPWATWLTGICSDVTTVNDETAVWMFVTNDPNFGLAKLADFKAGKTDGTITVDASTSVLALIIEVDDWLLATDAYVDDIAVNGVPYPVGCSNYVATSQDFAVTARVTNTGDAMATNIPVTIDPGTKASVVPPEDATRTVDIPYGESVILTWTLHCDAQGSDTITVSADGLTTVTDSVAVQQYPAAHLEVQNIDASESTITVCENFTVTADIVNTGEADASEVTATLSVFPEGSARVVEGGYTKTVGDGTLVGHEQDGNAEVSWELHCKVACETTITITAEGYDEFGWHLKQDPQTGETILVSMPGRAIDERNIEPASVTVKQLRRTVVDLAVSKSVDNDRPLVNDELVFTITVTNNGPDAATGVEITDSLPSGLTFYSASASKGGYDSGTGVWAVDGLGVGMTATLLLEASVGAADPITNEASVSADQDDWNSFNDSDSVTLNQEPVAFYDINLSAGWNLISMPLIPKPTSAIGTVLVGIEDNIAIPPDTPTGVWALDAEIPDWLSNVPPGWAGSLTEMRDGTGYWIVMANPDILRVNGVEIELPPATPPTYQVFEGWNLIGFKSVIPRKAGDYLAAIAGKYTIIYRYAGGVFSAVQASDNFIPGQGYWIAIILEPGTIYP